MDTTKLKKFAQFARRVLLEQVEAKLEAVLADSSAARRESDDAVKKLEDEIERLGRVQVIEQVAYTWFNRFCALRYMDVIHVHLIVSPDDIGMVDQEKYFSKIQENVGPIGIIFDWEFRNDLHARHIITDHGWEILLDRGLDVFQPCDMKDVFSPTNRLQKFRQCKKFEVTFRRKDG